MRLAWVLWMLSVGCGRFGFEAERQVPGGDSSTLTLSYPRAALAAVVNVTALSLKPTVSDATARFAVEPALPAGLVLDPATGTLSGVPTGVADRITYTIAATTSAASAFYAIELIVLPGYVVDIVADEPDLDGGVDAVCKTVSGGCSLRAALQTTNRRATKQLILLDATSYPLESELPSVKQDVVVAGRGASETVIRAEVMHAEHPAMMLEVGATLALRDLELRDFGGKDGGALAVIAGTLDVDGCRFTNNVSPGSGGVLFINGGARATFARSLFTDNSSLGGPGGGWGGAIDAEGSGTAVVVRQSAATGNITAWGSFAHITAGSTLRLENSTLYGNKATVAGTLATPGGVYTVINSTIVGNFSSNAAPRSAGLYIFSAPGAFTVTNSLIADNRDADGNEYDCERADLTTTITSGGGNLFGDKAASCAKSFVVAGDQLGVEVGPDPGGLADHGGPTPTLMVDLRSPAVDGGNDAACPALDQRGVKRPRGAHCDVGALELP